jgi:hypothetical protein
MRITQFHGFVDHSRRSADRLRFGLGMLQMGAATVAVVLLFLTGLSPVALVVTVFACTLTTISVLLFGAIKTRQRSPRHKDDSHDRAAAG